MATSGWLTKAGPFPVEHLPMPAPGSPVTLTVPRKVVQHTTEGSTIEGALAVFRQHYAPAFTVGLDVKKRPRLIQHIPIGRMAAALENRPGGVETNREVLAQIELVGFSQKRLWLPRADVLNLLAALYAELNVRWGVLLRHVNNPTRSSANWMMFRGVYGHCDVPENAHWDPGNLDWAVLFKLARQYVDGMTVGDTRLKPKPKLTLIQRARQRGGKGPVVA